MKTHKAQSKEKNNCVCILCNKIIFRKIDDYCHIIDYRKGKFYIEGFYHTKCYVDKIKQNADVSSVTKKAMGMLNSLGIKLGIEEKKEEVYNLA